MKQPTVRSIKSKTVLGVLVGFAVTNAGVKFAVVRSGRNLDALIEVSELTKNYEVQNV